MTKIRKILVPIDFSECSKAALDTASGLAASFDAQIDLIHVWDAPAFIAPEIMVGAAGSAQTLAKFADEQARLGLKEFSEDARSRGIAVAGTRVVQGDTAGRICEIAEGEGYDLIAMGTQGRSGLAHLFLGSVAEKVVRHSKVPVLTVRNKPHSS